MRVFVGLAMLLVGGCGNATVPVGGEWGGPCFEQSDCASPIRLPTGSDALPACVRFGADKDSPGTCVAAVRQDADWYWVWPGADGERRCPALNDSCGGPVTTTRSAAPALAVCYSPPGELLAAIVKCAGHTAAGLDCHVCRDYAGCVVGRGEAADYCVDAYAGCNDPACAY